ncbi:MAG: ATP-binding protein [Phycisphaeraceae bacterium]
MTVNLDKTAAIPPAEAEASDRLDDLAQIIGAYNQVTENLQRSHESLRAQVVRLQQQLASTDAQLQRSKRLAALGEMAAGIAHEIRNPLAAIQLYADMIGKDLRTEDAQPGATCAANARKIAEAVRRLNAIVTDVLSFAQEVTPNARTVSVTQLFDRAVESHRPAIDAAGVTVVRRDRPLGSTIHADPDLLHQALLNTIRNAVEAMAAGRNGVLTLAARPEDGQVVLTVRDTGPGIGAADIDRLFNPFFTTRNTGTGLGLAIVHRIVDAHGGTISVHNDGGAVFELRVPAVSLSDAPNRACAPAVSGVLV